MLYTSIIIHPCTCSFNMIYFKSWGWGGSDTDIDACADPNFFSSERGGVRGIFEFGGGGGGGFQDTFSVSYNS